MNVIKNLGVVAGDGIEPSTRGFSVRRSAQFGASKPKTAKKISTRRPNRPTRPSLYRAPRELTDRTRPSAHALQRVARIATELFPNRTPTFRPSMKTSTRDSSRAVFVEEEHKPLRASSKLCQPINAYVLDKLVTKWNRRRASHAVVRLRRHSVSTRAVQYLIPQGRLKFRQRVLQRHSELLLRTATYGHSLSRRKYFCDQRQHLVVRQ